MNHKLNDDDKRQIAHFIAQKYSATMSSGGESNKTFNQYIEKFNEILDKTEEYNKSV